MTVSDSILGTTKQLLGIEPQYTAFDLDIILHINSVFSTLQQLGVGPSDGFSIMDDTANWVDYTVGVKAINMIKSYMMLRVRLLFDPPAAGFTTTSFDNQLKELEWRLNVAVDTNTTSGDSGGGTIDPDDVADAVDAYLEANPVADGVVLTQSTPLSTWTLSHSLHRVPVVAVYIDGEEVDADVEATDTQVIISFPTPTAGFAVLT